MRSLTISKAARKAGVGVETIRYYERRGLIARPLRPAAGGFRDYPEATLGRIRFIREAQELGFSLAEIAELLALRADPKTNCRAVQRRAEAKRAEVRSKVARLKRIEAALGRLIVACPGEGVLGACSILEALEGVDEAGTTPRRRKLGRAGHDDYPKDRGV